LTLATVAESRKAPLVDATVTATGSTSRGSEGRYGFRLVEVEAELETTPGGEDSVRAAAQVAERLCVTARVPAMRVRVVVSVAVVATPRPELAGAASSGAAKG